LEFTGKELKLLWRDAEGRQNQVMRTHWNTPLLHENRLYASSGRNPPDTDIRCIEFQADQTPKTVWAKRNRDRGTGLIVDGHWLWLGEFGKMHLMKLGAQDHEVLAEMDLQGTAVDDSKEPLVNPPSWAPPVLSHGLLFVRGSDRIICLELIPETP
jgi:hypothetical protein